jgi:hypothetical protein
MLMRFLVGKQSLKFQATAATADGSLNVENRLADDTGKYVVFFFFRLI